VGRSMLLEFVAGAVYAAVFIVATFIVRAWRPSDIEAMMPLAARYPRSLGRLLPALADWAKR
jgi:hypothetical protein